MKLSPIRVLFLVGALLAIAGLMLGLNRLFRAARRKLKQKASKLWTTLALGWNRPLRTKNLTRPSSLLLRQMKPSNDTTRQLLCAYQRSEPD